MSPGLASLIHNNHLSAYPCGSCCHWPTHQGWSSTAICRLPELSAARHREHSSSAQPHHPEASRPSEHMQQPQGEQLVQKLQQKLQGQGDSSGPTAADTALAAIQPQTDHQSVKQHHKGSHAHFADNDSNALDDGFTERNESITAVRGAARGEGGSHAEGTFWKKLDSEGSSIAATGWCLHGRNNLQDAQAVLWSDHTADCPLALPLAGCYILL